MEKVKKCAICKYEYRYSDNVYISPFLKPASDGAKYYYDLWHYNIEVCPNCGYASADVMHTLNKKIIEEERYNEVSKHPIIVELNQARPNRIAQYIKASIYYESIGEKFDMARSILQAGDLVFAEMLYWEEYILDNSSSISAIISKSEYNDLKKFADGLYQKGLDVLEEYVAENTEDYDALLLLAGTYGDGDRLQAMKGVKILNSLKNAPLSAEQKQALAFLLEQVN